MNLSKVQRLAAECGLTKKEIAERCGFTRVTLDNLLQGADVKISTIETFAKVMGISTSELFDKNACSIDNSILETYKKEIERLNSLLNKRTSTKVVVEMEVSSDEFVRMGLKEHVIQVLNKKKDN